MQEAGDVTDQPRNATNQQKTKIADQLGAKSVDDQPGARSVDDQKTVAEEEEEWRPVSRQPFSYQSPYVTEKLKRVKEAAVEADYLPYTPENRSHNKRVKVKVNKALQKQRIDRINKEGFKKEG